MAGLLRKIMPAVPSTTKHDDDDDGAPNVEYSFAIEYSGPQLSYDIPRVLPIAVDEIPVAAVFASPALLNNSSLPVIQPIVKRPPIDQKLSKERKSSFVSTFSHNSSINSGVSSNGPNLSCELPYQGNSNGAAGCLTHCDCKLKSSGSMSSGKVKSVDGQRNSCEGPDCAAGIECTPTLSGVTGSSGKLETSDCHANLHVSVELPADSEKGAEAGFEDYMNPANSESTESGLSSHAVSSEVFSCKEEDFNDEGTSCHMKRPSVVTFLDPKPSDVVAEESECSPERTHVRPKAERRGKKGSCYRCLKRSRFTEKEACIVCGAKYCSDCVLRAMGSMPEGRKCVTCIGFRIDDARRETLGKASRMLKRLLTEMEVKRVMKSEISCQANQLPPEYVFVNGEHLSQQELDTLRCCANPPKKLNRGYYWYDKVAGFWGKVGHKPCQIISPRLNIGGQIMRNASNGNTNVTINNREITKKELLMLQLAGVQCEGTSNFWVNADGSCVEEGMNIEKGRLWSKARMKLVCALLSLPAPPDSLDHSDEEVNGDANSSNPEKKKLCKLLLIGHEKSGTSTIYKQAKSLFNVPFSEDERQNIKIIIQSNLYWYIGVLLEGRDRFEEEILTERRKLVMDQPGTSANAGQIDDKTLYSIGPRLKSFSDWLLKVMVSGNLEAIFPAATREYAPFVEELLKDSAFQATYNRRNELDMLPRIATYFLERAVEISRTTYEPSDLDILYAEGITSSSGLSCMEFSFPKPAEESTIDFEYQNDCPLRYELIRVHPRSLGENFKWLEMFECVDIVLFCVSLTDYDEFFEDNNGVLTNKMLASKQLFESIVTHPTMKEKDFLLLLNKYDLLEEKIEQCPLTHCEWFHDFDPVISHNHYSSSRRNNNNPRAQYAFHYIALKFKRLFHSLTDGKLFVSQVTGLEPETVEQALRYAGEILNWEEEEPNYTNNESSYTDYDASSSA